MLNHKLRVFLCHASQDKPVVHDLYQRLLGEGWIDPWLDEEKLLPGQDWDMEIEKAVEAADAVIVCLSSRSVGKEGYIQKELRFVLDIALEKPEGAIFVIPLRLDKCQVPRRLRSWQYADYFPSNRERAYDRLLKSLQARQFAIQKVKEKVESGDYEVNSQDSLDYYTLFLLEEENEELNQLQSIASRKLVYGGTSEKAALRMELLQTLSPWIRYTIIVLMVPVPVLITYFVYVINTTLSIPFYCLFFIFIVTVYILDIGYLYRKLIDAELTVRIEKQEEKIKQLSR